MSTIITFGSSIGSFHTERSEKGKSLLSFPTDFTVLDLETTGLSPEFDEIIEIGCLRVRELSIIDSFQSLVHPKYEIDEYITELTGITNEMLVSAPTLGEILPSALEFISSDIVLGHNVNFDINFLYDASSDILNKPFKNDYLDTMRLSRRILPELPHHRLKDLVSYFNIATSGEHRSFCDCESTLLCYQHLLDIASQNGDPNDYLKSFIKKSKSLDLREISATTDNFDCSHPLYGKRCVFTGTLEKMTRAEAAQLVVNIGGICDNGVTKNTNFLILGANDYSKIKDGKSSKQKRAEELKLKGIDIEVIPESVFYDLILDD